MQGETKMTGKQMWELFKIQDKFFEEIHSIIEKLDERIDKNGFKSLNSNLLDVNMGKDDYLRWSPLGVQFSFKKNDEFIGINFVFREFELDVKINEPIIIYSRYVLEKEKESHQYDNYNIVNKLAKENKLIFDGVNPLNDVCFGDNRISRGFLKVEKLFDITKGERVIRIAKDINSWK